MSRHIELSTSVMQNVFIDQEAIIKRADELRERYPIGEVSAFVSATPEGDQ